MLEALKSLYGQAFTYYNDSVTHPEDFYWLESETNIQFGIRKSAVTERELQLLKIHYTLVETSTFSQNAEQQAWAQLLFNGITVPENEAYLFFPCYPIFINFKSPLNDYSVFEEAMKAIFTDAPVIIWKDSQAVLILKHANDLTYADEIVDLMATELYMDVTVLKGSVLKESAMAHIGYDGQNKLFLLAQKLYPRQRVFTLDYLIPLYLVKEVPTHFSKVLLGKINEALTEGGEELQETLMTFLQNNMNVSTASKALYIHRNSLQYRLDKFTEKTGLDPKTFEDAIVIYLGILKYRLDNLVNFTQEIE